jgi:FkbM family methyltransferase
MPGGGPKAQVKRALRGVGFELQRYDPDATFAKRRQRLLGSERIDLVIDVGAHAGEFASSLRHEGYGGRILSFEPQCQMFERLQAAASSDPLWDCRNQALGASPGSTTLHVSGNDGFSSSIRPMAAVHEEAEPGSSYVNSETVDVITLDEAMAETGGSLMLKIDTQGYESEVLSGGAATLRRCRLVELELVLAELYDGQAMFPELVDQMEKEGFVLTDVESGFRDPRTSQLLQIDGVFVRANAT